MRFKWTIVFLVHASDAYTRKYANELFRILEATKHSKEVKILVLYGSLQSSESAGYRIQVLLYELLKNGPNAGLALEVIKSYGVIDMGDDKKLGPIFSEVRKNYPSDRFLLFTWDHGSGFGIFKTNPAERFRNGVLDHGSNYSRQELELNAADIVIGLHSDARNAAVKRESASPGVNYTLDVITSEPLGAIHDKGVRGLEKKVKKKIKTSMLTNDELRNIIKHDSNNDQIDLLIMMNCMMQMIETGYALHDAVEYLVAPQTCIFWAGYDYISIINQICENPGTETEAVARYAIDTIEHYYKSTPFKDGLKDLVISLVKPSKSKDVKDSIDLIADELCDDLKVAEADIKMTRNKSEDLSKKYVHGIPYHFVDFEKYISSLSRRSPLLNIDVENLNRVIKDYVIHIFKGSNYNQMEDGCQVVNGFSIYFPPTSDEAYNDYYYEWFYKEGKYQTLFADKCRWKRFLIKYFQFERR